MFGDLPTISQMYHANSEYNILNTIKKYQSSPKSVNTSKRYITKKDHYLDLVIKSSTSPGPANSSNYQRKWGDKSNQSLKASDRKTYISEVQFYAKKTNIPSPNAYLVKMPWPTDTGAIKVHVGDKLDFIDNAQFQSDQIPGVGAYQIRTPAIEKVGGRLNPLPVLKEKENPIKADMNTYTPCEVSFNTFRRIQLNNKEKKTSGVPVLQKPTPSKCKENVPGPGKYQMVNTWKTKKQLKKDQLNYLSFISKGPQNRIYN